MTRQFYHDGFKRKRQDYAQCCDKEPVRYFYTATSLIDRLKAKRCELCGKENVKLDMHHVRKLKNLQGKEDWERHMIARKRKTIALCRSCHKKLTVDGKTDRINGEPDTPKCVRPVRGRAFENLP